MQDYRHIIYGSKRKTFGKVLKWFSSLFDDLVDRYERKSGHMSKKTVKNAHFFDVFVKIEGLKWVT